MGWVYKTFYLLWVYKRERMTEIKLRNLTQWSAVAVKRRWRRREAERHKKIQTVSPWRILFGKGRREWKRWIAQVFKVWNNQKTVESFWQKVEEEEVQRDSEVVKDCILKVVLDCWNAKESLAFIDSSCLVKRTTRRVMTFRKT